MTPAHPDPKVVAAVLLMFPPRLRAAVIEDATLRHWLPSDVNRVITLTQTGTEFVLSKFLQVVRQALAAPGHGIGVEARDGTAWRVACDHGGGITVACDGVVVSFPEFVCFAPSSESRTRWLDRQAATHDIGKEDVSKWRQILAGRPLENEELEDLLDEFRLTPQHWSAVIRDRLRRPEVVASDLVPGHVRYFERLVGVPSADASVEDFLSNVLAARVRALVDWNSYEGLRTAFTLSAHPRVAELIDLEPLSGDQVRRVFEWLADHGDRISQMGAIECGLRQLGLFPEIEQSLATMIRAICADDPDDPGGRLKLLSGLVVMVDGEVSCRRITRSQPPFWRRLASIAHAALLEREVIDANLGLTDLAAGALRSGGHRFYAQTLVDLRREPRWFPDYISSRQLKAEFIGRISNAAVRYGERIPDGELKLLLREARSEIQPEAAIFAALPGPLEGGGQATNAIPAELESDIRTSLEAEEVTAKSFFGLVNSSLIFRVDARLSELAARGLVGVGYRLPQTSGSDDPFLLLNGLAMVSAVTRSMALAKEVRNLCRVVRQRNSSSLPLEMVIRIALVAASANEDLSSWSDFVGDWLTELAFAEMTCKEAVDFQGDLYALLHMEPVLWETCGRAEAALAAFLGSFPDEPKES